MPSKQKRKTARQNGAKAAGSKTPQGIQTSAMNALRHGLTSQTLVLANESPSKFAELLQMYIEKFKPQDCIEMNLVDEMVAARWRQQRGWVIQTASIDLQMETQEFEIRSEPQRLALAFITMANQEKVLELIMRYETSYSRMHDRAMKALFRLREKQNLRNDPKPVPPAPPPDPCETVSAQGVVRTSERSEVRESLRNVDQPKPSDQLPAGPVETNPGIVSVIDRPNCKPKMEI